MKTKICTIYLARDVVAVFTFNPILVVAVILGGIDPLAAELNRVGAGPVIDHLLLHVAVGCLHVSALVLILSGTTGSLELSQLEPYSWLAWTQPCQWPAISLALSGLFLWSVPWLERALREPETDIMSIKCPSSVVPKRAKTSFKNLKILLGT